MVKEIEDIAKLTPPLDLLGQTSHDPDRIRTVAAFKRLADLWCLDGDFRERYRLEPEQTLAETRLSIEPEAFRLYLNPEERQKLLCGIKEGRCKADVLPESLRLYFRALWERNQAHRQMREEHLVPEEPHLRAWRARQERRCLLQMGSAAAHSMMQLPLVFELSDGCSVGCPFCGLAAGKLRGVFRYTEINAVQWRETLSRLHALIGDAAGFGLCYYATEPLDNPDYEQFVADWYGEFGITPMLTTAASVRDIERTRALLCQNDKTGCYFHRLSVLSPAMRDVLFSAFTPEELLRVILLPQFPEAPGNVFTKAGRNRDQNNAYAETGTISCASGFIVNMWEQTVRLETPFVSDPTHPTGEWILEKCAFTSAADLQAQIRRMIMRYMPDHFDLKRPSGTSIDFRLEETEGKIRVAARGGSKILLQDCMGQAALDTILDALREHRYTGQEILDFLPEGTDAMTGFLLLNLLWYHGLIDQTTE